MQSEEKSSAGLNVCFDIVIKNCKSNFDWPKELTIIIRTDLFSSKPPAGFILGQKVPEILLWHFQDFTRYITIG